MDTCLCVLREKDNPEVLEGFLATHMGDEIGGRTHILEKHPGKTSGPFRLTGIDLECPTTQFKLLPFEDRPH